MKDTNQPVENLLYDLQERAKELNCLYKVQELLANQDLSIDEICQGIIRAIPPGWQYPEICQAKITFNDLSFQSPGFIEAPWSLRANITVREQVVGEISVYYTEERTAADEGPFLKEERKLIDTIVEQLGLYILHQQLKEVFERQQQTEIERKPDWWIILNLLKRTDPTLMLRIARKMINHLYWNGIEDAKKLLERFTPAYRVERELLDDNQPFRIAAENNSLALAEEVFEIASLHIREAEILERIQHWIKEDQSGFLVNTLVNPSSSLADISASIERYHHLALQGLELSPSRDQSVRASMIRRILSDQPDFIKTAKDFLHVDDYFELMRHIIYPADSHGKLGGKSSGLFLASQILAKSSAQDGMLKEVKTPKTWYIASDSVFYFMGLNNLEDIAEQKYKSMDRVRQEYPYVIHMFKNSPQAPEIIRGLSLALDDFGETPLIVRSSSILEDRQGMAFAGKYKSLFIANQGPKEQRLLSLIDAIAEIYASTFSPDPIHYRMEHDLIEHHEEMGIMIQEVVGNRVGPYFFPTFAGVAFSHNEFRWSSRIRRQDGLIRLVPGLGTRAVDRLSSDYPILIAPGQPGLRTNITWDEIVRYSPKMIDVINMDKGQFETIAFSDLAATFGRDVPGIHQVVSVMIEDQLTRPSPIGIDFTSAELVVTFDGLITRTNFIEQISAILNELQEKLGHPVDIEFAHDGTDFYLLQCRAQSYNIESKPVDIPVDIPAEDIIFSANKFIMNGAIEGITHIVYVDPYKYSELAGHNEMLEIGAAIGKLNQVLPRRKFILMGPGRWGSRGDIKLGVRVTYSDINNTSLLVEIARQHKGYIPDPSFGTHFFQDLVEASIRYLPLYPDTPGIQFNESFLSNSPNILPSLAPEYSHLEYVVRVIDIPNSANGKTLQILMNSETEQALAYLVDSE